MMQLTIEEQSILSGHQGPAARKAMEILIALGKIYGADRLIPVSSVQVSGVSYDNLGEAGLQWLAEMADLGGRAQVLTTLNPAGMDIENWEALGISPEFAQNQTRVLDAFARMNVVTTCTCTPYLSGNIPSFGQHIAWAESSAVCYANSVIGARTNREGGPSALAAALVGRTPNYGFHLDHWRKPGITIKIDCDVSTTFEFGALGKVIGEILEKRGQKAVPYISGIQAPSMEELKSFCASIATYGGAAMFHLEGITPEANQYPIPTNVENVSRKDIESAIESMNSIGDREPDFVSLGCPHLSIQEIAHLAELLKGKTVKKEFWVTTSRPVKQIADRMGFTQSIEEAGALFATDTCCVVAPIGKRFHSLVTDSAKACYYAFSKNKFQTIFKSFDDVVQEALR